MEPQIETIDSTTYEWNKTNDLSSSNVNSSTRYDPNEMPTVNSTNPNYHSNSMNNSHMREKSNATHETTNDKGKVELKRGQQNVEDILTKSKRLVKEQCKSFGYG
jgi:hypothetical protein